MPRKNTEKYQHYDAINTYYAINALWSNLGEIGISLVGDWERWSADVTNAMGADVETLPQEAIFHISPTNQYYRTIGNNLLNRGKRLASDLEKKMQEYNGPFKEILESVNYINNPANGNLLDLFVDQPVLNQVFMTSCSGMPCTTMGNIHKGKGYTVDTAINEERKKALGGFYSLYTDYFKASKDFAEVLFERQKAEKDKKTGLDAVYAKKYAVAIDQMVSAYDRLKSAADERYSRKDLSEREKDLEYMNDPVSNQEIKVLNNALNDITSANPDKICRNNMPAAMANLRAQSKAIKAGWDINDARIMGLLAEAEAEATEGIKNIKLSLKRGRERIAELEQKIEESVKKNQDPAEEEKKLESEKKDLKYYEEKQRKAEQARKDARELYKKYENIQDPTFFQKQDALKDFQELLKKYREKKPNDCVLQNVDEGFAASEEKLTDPYDFNGKTRLQQAQAMLKTLKDVNTWGRSSDNFEKLKNKVEKLVELAGKLPENMSKEQFQEYERQNEEVIKKAYTYINGKNKQQSDYKAAHNGDEMPISEYTARRINAVRRLLSMARTHISIASEGHTKEYTGTPHERAMALYERRTREEARRRTNMLGSRYMGASEGKEIYDLTREAFSFSKSVYIEKMKERYELDPAFTAQDFSDSLLLSRIYAGASEEHEKMIKKNARFKEHLQQALYDRVNMDEEEDWMVTFDTEEYVIRGEIPKGVGHDWVKFELKNYRAMCGIPEPSEEDYMSESESEGPESDGSEMDKSEIEDFKIKESEIRKSDSKMDESIDLDIIDTSSKKNKSIGFDIIETDSKKRGGNENFEIDFIVPRDNLAGKIFEAMRTENLRKNEDPEYLSIARDIADHAAREKLGANTKLPLETMMKMAKYLDKGCDNKKPTLDETTRWGVVCSAFNQYQQKDAAFEKNAGEFMFDAKLNPKKNYGPGYYKGLYYEALDKSTEEAGKAYQAKPDDQKLTKAVKNKAYQVLMTDMVESTFARAKGVTYAKINNSFDSADNKKLRDGFIKDLPEDFKTNYEKLILDGARQGTFNRKFASDACDKALAMTMDERKKATDAGNAKNANKSTKSQAEKQLDELLDMMKRDSRRVNQFREKAPAPEKSPIKK